MNHHFNRFHLRTVSAVVAMAFAAQAAWAVDPFTVSDIRIEGLQRVEPGTVFASLPVRVGDTYNDEKGSGAINALFSLGLFKDVRLETNGNVLVVVVQERPTIADVDFAGSREFDKDALKKSMRDIGLTDGRPFDKALADRAEQELKRQYISRSLYGASVLTTVSGTHTSRNLAKRHQPSRAVPSRAKVTRPFNQKPSSAPLMRPARLPGAAGTPSAVSPTKTSQSNSNCARPTAM